MAIRRFGYNIRPLIMGSINRFLMVCLGAGMVFSSTALGASEPKRFGLGGMIGGTVTNVANHPLETKSLKRFQVAGFLNYRLTRMISYQMDLVVIGKGYNLPNMEAFDSDDTLFIFSTSITALITYVEMPIMLKISAPVRGKFIPYLLGGGYGSFLLSNKLRLPDSVLLRYGEHTLANVKKLEAGAIVGAGLDITAGDGFVTLETRYEIGLTTVIKKQPQKNRAWTFAIGYWF